MNVSSLLRRFVALCCVLSIASPALAFAGPEEALEYYEQAKSAYGSGEFQRAANLLERAYAEDPDLIYQYNRIRALQAQGRYDEALRVLNIYKGPMSRDEEKRFDDIAAIEGQLREQIKKQESQPPKEDPKDPEETTPPVEDPKDPVDVEDPGATDGDDGASTKKIIGWSMVGVGAATLIPGLILSSGALLPETSDPDYEDTRQTQIITAATLDAVGAGLTIAGVILVLTADGGEDESAHLGTTPIITPYLSRDGAGAGVLWRF